MAAVPVVNTVRRGTTWLRRRLGRAVFGSYVSALLVPGPGLWLRQPHELGTVQVHVPPVLLGTLVFAAGFQVQPRTLAGLVRRPWALVAALLLHLVIPLVVIPPLVALMRATPDSDRGSGIVTAMVLIVTMPVAANATVWTAKGSGDQPAMVAAVLGSTLLSPVTTPLAIFALVALLPAPYAHTLIGAAQLTHGGFSLWTIVMPCAAGLMCRSVACVAWAEALEDWIAPVALGASLLTTYANASGALGSFLTQPRPLMAGAAATAAIMVCGTAFLLGHTAGALLRLGRDGRSSLALACGMSNSSAGAVMITAALPNKPCLLVPVLAYGVMQKTFAGFTVRQRVSEPRLPEGR